ncbi:hypothetical protein EV361DRAFT_867497 [Lentinula raphanica]|nr:hypothetical protein EV361DRAFT_867497 [Lentinula raphanica]
MDSHNLQPFAHFSSTNGDAVVRCKRSQCGRLLPKKDLRFIANINPNQAGRHLCPDCYDRKLSQSSTVFCSASGSSSIGPGPNRLHMDDVRGSVNAAQRGVSNGSNAVRAMVTHKTNTVTMGSGRYTPVQHHPQLGTSTYARSGPDIAKPLHGMNFDAPPPLPQLQLAQPIIGYSDAHKELERYKLHYQQLAFTKLKGEEIMVQGILYYRSSQMPIHRSIPQVSETVDWVPVHIGASDLKRLVYFMLLEKYLDWSKQYPLQIKDCELRDGSPPTKHPIIQSKNPFKDVDAIAHRFFKSSGKKAPSFNTAAARKATPIALFISEQHFEAVMVHLEKLEEGLASTSNLPPTTSLETHDVSSVKKGKRKEPTSPRKPLQLGQSKRQITIGSISSTSRNNMDTAPHSAPHMNASVNNDSNIYWHDSVPSQDLRAALQTQSSLPRHELLPIYRCLHFPVVLYMLPESDLEDISVASPKIFQNLKHHEQLLVTISYPVGAKPTYGAFKRSY